MLRRFALPLAFALAASNVGVAQDTQDSFSVEDLQRAEAARDAALARLRALEDSEEVVNRELADIDADLIAAAADARRREEAATSAELRLASLSTAADDARARLTADEEALEDLLAALMSLGANPPPALITSADDAGDAVRAAILMGDAAPQLADRADKVAKEIDALARLRRDIEAERNDLNKSEAALLARRQEIEALAQEKRGARLRISQEAEDLRAETDRLAQEADTLRELLDRLAAAAPTGPGRKPGSGDSDSTGPSLKPRRDPNATPQSRPSEAPPLFVSRGGVPTTPASGSLVRRYGAVGPAGERQRGHSYATRGGAQIIAPLDARVEYAGLFRSYGQILILDVGDSYLVVLAGLGAIYVETGQLVLAGEPVGRMADQKSPPPELYLEVRYNGQPIDPEGWIQRGA